MDILNTLIEISVYSGIIFAAVILLKKCFQGKMSPLMHYLIWILLIIRLMVPVTIASPLHLFTIPSGSENLTSANTQTKTDQNTALPVTNDSDASGIQPQDWETYEQPQAAADIITVPAIQTPSALSLNQIILIIWLSGTSLCLLYLSAIYFAMRRKFLRNYAHPSKRLGELFKEVKAEMSIRANINLICQYEYGTPSLMFPKTIMMPLDTLAAMNDEEIKFALRHELTHYKRGDHIVNILLSLLNAVYWFDPIVWVAFRQIRKDMEMACDNAVVRNLDKAARNDYASLIISMFARPAHRQIVIGMNSNVKKVAEQRVRRIYMKNKSKPGVKVIAAVLTVVMFICCFTTACQPVPEKKAEVGNYYSLPVKYISVNNEQVQPSAPESSKPAAEYQVNATGEHMKTVIKPNSQVTINVDADVTTQGYVSLPAVRLKHVNLPKEKFDRIINYIAGSQPLYYVTYNQKTGLDFSKEEITAILAHMNENLKNNDLPNDEKNAWKEMEKTLEGGYNDAPSKADEKQYEGTLTWKDNNSTFNSITDLKCYMGKDRTARFSLLQSSEGNKTQLTFENNNYGFAYNTFEPYQGVDAPRMKTAYSDAKKTAEDFVHAVDGEDSSLVLDQSYICYNKGSFAGYTKETSPQAYAFQFERSFEGANVKYVNGLEGEDKTIDYSRCVDPESFQVVIDDNGISFFGWVNYTEYVEPVSGDSKPLMDFSSIKDIFEQYCKEKFTWIPDDDSTPKGLKVTLNVKRVELNLMAIPQNGDFGSCITIPVWDFITDESYDKKGVREEDGAPAYEQKDFAIVTINALDGTIISREQGY